MATCKHCGSSSNGAWFTADGPIGTFCGSVCFGEDAGRAEERAAIVSRLAEDELRLIRQGHAEERAAVVTDLRKLADALRRQQMLPATIAAKMIDGFIEHVERGEHVRKEGG